MYEAIIDSDAILVLTEWEDYSLIDWGKVSKIMRHPAWVFDTRSIVNIKEAQKYGIRVWQVGYGNLKKDNL